MAIEINYQKTIRKSEEMNELSRQINAELMRLENLLLRIKTEWRGPASDEFQRQLTKLINDVKRTKENVAGISKTIEAVAESYKRADDKIAGSL